MNLCIFKLRFHLDNLTSSPVKTQTRPMKPQQRWFQWSSSHAGAGQATLRAQTDSDTHAAFAAREGGGETPPWHSTRLRDRCVTRSFPSELQKALKMYSTCRGNPPKHPPPLAPLGLHGRGPARELQPPRNDAERAGGRVPAHRPGSGDENPRQPLATPNTATA